MSWLRFITEPPATPKGVDRPKPPPTTGVHYDTEWAHRPAAKLVRRAAVFGFFKPATRYYAKPRVIGADRLASVKSPVIIAANHRSHADTSLLLATLPGRLRENLAIAAGADYFFPGKITSALSALFIGAIPIERTKLSKLSIANSLSVLDKGRNLLIFPEGGRSRDGWPQKHRPGAAFLAKRTNAPVIPVYLDGTGALLPKGKNWPTRSATAVVFGPPLRIDEGEDPREFAHRIEEAINQLADEFDTGWWKARLNAHRAEVGESTESETDDGAGAWRRRWALGPKPGTARSEQNSPRWPRL